VQLMMTLTAAAQVIELASQLAATIPPAPEN
jgi:hypothetical protein